jgi:hypothetical protein
VQYGVNESKHDPVLRFSGRAESEIAQFHFPREFRRGAAPAALENAGGAALRLTRRQP